MKKAPLLFLICLPAFLASYGQESTKDDLSIRQKSPWSVTFSYTPYFAFLSNSKTLSEENKIYPAGFNIAIDRKLRSERTGISLGFTYRIRNFYHTSTNSNRTYTLLEFPIQVKYHLKKVSSNFDPYLAPAIRICRYKEVYDNIDPPGSVSLPYSVDYLPIVDFGYGSIIRLNRNFDFLIENNIGYGLTKVLPNRCYIDLLAGLRYKF
jgi:hypothetical protein